MAFASFTGTVSKLRPLMDLLCYPGAAYILSIKGNTSSVSTRKAAKAASFIGTPHCASVLQQLPGSTKPFTNVCHARVERKLGMEFSFQL